MQTSYGVYEMRENARRVRAHAEEWRTVDPVLAQACLTAARWWDTRAKEMGAAHMNTLTTITLTHVTLSPYTDAIAAYRLREYPAERPKGCAWALATVCALCALPLVLLLIVAG